MFIYKIENKFNGKVYIGLTTKSEVGIRWNQHISALKSDRHTNPHLQNAWNKYGHLNFDFTIISEFPDDFDIKELGNIEIRTIALYDSYRNGYNLTPGGDGVRRLPEEFKYTICKAGKTHSGTPQFCIYDRNGKMLIRSVDKAFLESFLPLLNSDEEAGLKAIAETKEFKYTICKNGKNSSGTPRFCILDRNGKKLIQSVNKDFLDFVVELLNSNEFEWVIKESGKFKLVNKKLLKELYNNYDCEVLI